MYFPYLFSKASELLAVRDFAGKLGNPQKIVPVIEPVNAAGGLERLHAAFARSGDAAYVVENPHLLDLRTTTALAAWTTNAAPLFASGATFRPTLKEYGSTSVADIASFVARNGGRDIGLIVTTSRLSAADINVALGSSRSLVFMTSDADRVALVAELGSARVVEINDRFPSQRVNADYSGEEWFTRDHLDYGTVHGYPGFSDYTVLPDAATMGGGAPGAVAVHLTFPALDSSVWVQHFVSDETDRNVGTPGSKLLEAIDYISAEVTANPAKFDSSPALADYLRMGLSRSTTSLGKNKQLEIAHHLFVVARRLGI